MTEHIFIIIVAVVVVVVLRRFFGPDSYYIEWDGGYRQAYYVWHKSSPADIYPELIGKAETEAEARELIEKAKRNPSRRIPENAKAK